MEVKTVVRCYFKTFGDFVMIYSTDVSKDGILVKSDTPLQTGDPVRLEFKLRNDYPLIMGEGQVAHAGDNGAFIKFVQLDADSEKFLNEVVKVKAAELKPVPGAPAVTYDAEVVQEEATEESFELDDAFSGMQNNVGDVEEVEADAFEDVDTASFEDVNTEPEADFSGLSLDSQATEGEDPFGEVTSDFDAPATDAATASEMFAEQPLATGSQDEYEQDDSSDYEETEQSPANPQALFEGINESSSGSAAYTAAYDVPPGEATVGGSTTIFERISVIKERRALLIGAGIGLVAVLVGGGAWFFMGAKGAGTDPVKLAAVNAAPAALQAPETVSTAPVTAEATVAPATPTQAAPAVVAPAVAAPAVMAPAAVKTEPVAVVAKTAVSKPNSGSATQVVAIEILGDGTVAIRGNGAFKKVKHFTMSEPNRIIVDLYGVGKAFKGLTRNGTGVIARVRPGEHEGKLRFVLDLKKETGKIPAYDLSADGDGIVVRPGR